MTKEGTVLDGKYEIWKEVGRGGMSIVYLARDNRLNKQWAVKEIRNDGSKSTETLLKGLEREANILKNVDHPVLPRIVDIIDQKGTIYVVMDFIEGETISQRLKREGAQPQETVIEWGLQLASALDYLHKMNPPVIYRDMKPSNVMIKPEGGVKLIDFGTAKEYDVENLADTTALGTKGYAAPEQFGDSKGRGIYNTDERTDIYNLGATLYHMVTGMNPCEPPYEIRPIREWNPALSTGLEKILWKCTQADPKERYQNCSELIYALEHYNELDDVHKKKNRRKFIAFASTAVLTIATGAVMMYGRAGMHRIMMDNYNDYVEAGNNYRIEGEYEKAAEQYKLAFELNGSDSEAYEKYISIYVDADNEITESGVPALDLETGLNVVANRVKSGYGDVDQNDAVLYKLAFAYFDELKDYKTASKYFDMVDKKDKDYGELAEYYGSVAAIMSNPNINADDLIEKINDFASYNQSEYTNDDETKYINYKTIGQIYATYVQKNGVASQANQVMSQAVSDLSECTRNDFDINGYYYAYYDNLIEINEQLAKQAEDASHAKPYYENVLMYIDEFLTILDIKVDESKWYGIGGNNDNIYNTAYYNKMMKKADCYAALGEYDLTNAMYESLESALGKQNIMSAKVYAEHLDYIYRSCETKEQDPSKWKKQMPAQFEALLFIYEEGYSVKDIESNKTWKKRKSTMEMLKNNDFENEDEDAQETEAGETSQTETSDSGVTNQN
ncbi:MAG: serine/threonine-protein kinase [Lachnospiraceae bacterium]|nr:serine/threonine-protein kinase [Lachnospiraceae bacterium]